MRGGALLRLQLFVHFCSCHTEHHGVLLLCLQATVVSRLYGDAQSAGLPGPSPVLKAGDQATATFSTTALSTSPVGNVSDHRLLWFPAPRSSPNNYSVTFFLEL